AFLGCDLVERGPARLGIATGVRNAQRLEAPLHGAVFTVGPVEREENHIGARGQCPRIIARVELRNRVSQCAQHLDHRRTRQERNGALGGRTAEHDGDVQPVRHGCVFQLSPTISTSVSSSIPRAALACCLMSSINERTSFAVAPPSLTMKFPCTSEMTAPPTRVPFNPSSSISLPAGTTFGFLKMQPALEAAGWLVHRFRLKACIRSSTA